jgi:hypothetical protein
MDINRIAMNPWDFTLYESQEGSLILKVIFSEGEYKTDIGRFFVVDSLRIDRNNIEDLKQLAARIRAEYPSVSLPQLEKSELTITK